MGQLSPSSSDRDSTFQRRVPDVFDIAEAGFEPGPPDTESDVVVDVDAAHSDDLPHEQPKDDVRRRGSVRRRPGR